MQTVVVEVQKVCKQFEIPRKTLFSKWVTTTLATVNYHHSETPLELTIRIVDEAESQALNGQWRRCFKPTNVLSFPFENPPGMKLPLLGDIVVCAPVVAREADEQRKSVNAHWAHLIVHATLHLLGYDHSEEVHAHIMEDLEIQILYRLGFPNPYQVLESE